MIYAVQFFMLINKKGRDIKNNTICWLAEKEVVVELDDAGIARLNTELMRRAPFERVMAEGKTLFELDQTKSVASAIINTAQLGKELAKILEEQ